MGAVGAVGAVTVCGSSGSSEVYVGEVKSMRDAAVKSMWEQSAVGAVKCSVRAVTL